MYSANITQPRSLAVEGNGNKLKKKDKLRRTKP